MRKWTLSLNLMLLAIALATTGGPNEASAQAVDPQINFNRFYYYPYYYFPHNYWPVTGPKWPEQQGAPYQRPPAYMAFPAFKEKNWRYELYQPQKYYRGQHFFYDQY